MLRPYRDQLTKAYDGFEPGSYARYRREENAKNGLGTCHNCLEPFTNEERTAIWFCSPCCARCGDPSYRRTHPRVVATEDGFEIDLTDCGCSK